MKKHPLTLALSSILAVPIVSHAESKGGFADIGVHYLDWTSRTIEKPSTKSHKDDFGYLESRGGANSSWGEMYGFFGWENFYNGHHNKPGNEQRYTFENTSRIYLGDARFNPHSYAYGAYDSANRVNFHDDMFLYGTGYSFIGSGRRLRPFFVKRYTDQAYYTGDNGYVAGWVVGYNFVLDSEEFTLANWNEYELDRDTTYAVGNGSKEKLDGVVALWWSATSHITTGIQYRYTDGRLGEDFYQDAIVYSIKFNF